MESMNQNLIDKLVLDLKSSDPSTRERATGGLWRIWFWEKGKIAVPLAASPILVVLFVQA